MRIKCCLGCQPPKRHAGCHSTCPEYKEQRATIDARREVLLKIRASNSDYDIYVNRMRLKNGRKKRRNK